MDVLTSTNDEVFFMSDRGDDSLLGVLSSREAPLLPVLPMGNL